MNTIIRLSKVLLSHQRPLPTAFQSIYHCAVLNCKPRSLLDPEVTNNQDILLQNLKSATDVTDILYTVKKHHAIMNSRHLLQGFRSIFALQKTDSARMSNGEVVKSQDFKLLCKSLKSQARGLELSETIDALKTLSYLGVSTTSKLVQTLLQLLTKQVNDLSLQQITFLDFILKDFDSSPLVDALKLALPIVFEAQIRLKLDRDNVTQLSELLFYASRKNLSRSTMELLVDNLMKKRDSIDLKNAKSIVRSLCDLRDNDDFHRTLMHHTLDLIVDESNKCSYHDFDSLLSKLVVKFSNKNHYFYHEEFVNCATKFVVENDSGFEEGVWILRKASKFGFVNLQLLDYLAHKAASDKPALESCGSVILFSFINGFALADYRPENWKDLEPAVLKNATNRLKMIELPWIKFASDLCTLDCWPFPIFERIFNEEFLSKYLSREYNTLDYLQLLRLNQAVQTLCPSYPGPMPPQVLLDKAIDLNGTNFQVYPLKGALVKAFGGERYVVDGVYSKLGHFIDHVIILRKGGYPVAFPQEVNPGKRVYIENMKTSEDCRLVAVLCLQENCYSVNLRKLKGHTRLALQSLEALGLSVVPISIFAWEELLDQEKIPYLMQNIRLKCDILCSEANAI